MLATSDVGVALIAAGASILGAVVGGAVTGGVALKAEEKPQDFAREMDEVRQAEQREFQRRTQMAAARLVQKELIDCGGAMTTMARNPKADAAPGAALILPVTAWEAQSQYLALSVADRGVVEIAGSLRKHRPRSQAVFRYRKVGERKDAQAERQADRGSYR